MLRLDSRIARFGGGLLLAICLIRPIGFGFEFAGEAVQTDFAAYYTAGQMIEAGLSPYRYLITPEKIIWTSGDRYQHSQYIYPPLVAALFAPVARSLSYLMAKYAWWFVDLICLAGVMSFSRRAVRLPWAPWGWAYLIFAGLFHPLLVLLLRGQIDLVTLALVSAGLMLLARGKGEAWAGGLLGVAALVKFHAGFIFPFLLLRRKFRAAAGFALAAGAMLALNFVAGGPLNVQRYLAELPRISQYGGDGPPGSEMPAQDLALIAPLFPAGGGTIKDGFLFPNDGFEFVTNASFVELICCGAGFNLPRATASLAVWAFFLLAFGLLAWPFDSRGSRAYLQPTNAPDEYLYWFAVMNVALLAGPTTWTMNAIWLLPAFPLLLYMWQTPDRSLAMQIAIAVFAAGLMLVAMPDHRGFPALFPRALVRLSIYKYPLGELLLMLGALVYLRRRRLEAPAL
jgi:hypothetical protein